MKNKILVASYFLSHSAVSKLFFTSDEQCFFQEQDAINHANDIRVGLKDKAVYPFDRADVTNEIAELSDDAKPYSEWKKEDLLSEMAGRSIKMATNVKKEVIVAALEADDQRRAELTGKAYTEVSKDDLLYLCAWRKIEHAQDADEADLIALLEADDAAKADAGGS